MIWGGYIAEAAQKAAGEVDLRSADLLAPVTPRRQELSSLSGMVADAPDFAYMVSRFTASTRNAGPSDACAGVDLDGMSGSDYPGVGS